MAGDKDNPELEGYEIVLEGQLPPGMTLDQATQNGVEIPLYEPGETVDLNSLTQEDLRRMMDEGPTIPFHLEEAPVSGLPSEVDRRPAEPIVQPKF